MHSETYLLNTVDLSKTLGQEDYEKLLRENQAALSALVHQVYSRQRPVVMVIEGWDAAGKGETIRRVTENIDPRGARDCPYRGSPNRQVDRGCRPSLFVAILAAFTRSWSNRAL